MLCCSSRNEVNGFMFENISFKRNFSANIRLNFKHVVLDM